MSFYKYQSIDNVTNKRLEHLKDKGLYNPEDIWVIT